MRFAIFIWGVKYSVCVMLIITFHVILKLIYISHIASVDKKIHISFWNLRLLHYLWQKY